MIDSYNDETGEHIARALCSDKAAAVRSALIGCEFYSDDPDQREPIIEAPVDQPVLLTSQNGKPRRLPYRLLEKGYVIPNSPALRIALQAARTPRDEQLERVATILARQRINAAPLVADDAMVLATAFADTDVGLLPDTVLRQQCYALLRRYDLYRPGVALLEKWRAMMPAESDDEAILMVQLTACYRHAGAIEQALAMTERLIQRAQSLNPKTKAIFATERAAILLDLFERDHVPAHLLEARHWAGIAWSINPSEYVSMVYRRLSVLAAPKNQRHNPNSGRPLPRHRL